METQGPSEIHREVRLTEEEELRQFCQDHYIIILDEDVVVRQSQINEAHRSQMHIIGSGEEEQQKNQEHQHQQQQQQQDPEVRPGTADEENGAGRG